MEQKALIYPIHKKTDKMTTRKRSKLIRLVQAEISKSEAGNKIAYQIYPKTTNYKDFKMKSHLFPQYLLSLLAKSKIMESNYKKEQRAKAVKLIFENNKVFYGGVGGEYFMRSKRDFVLTDYQKNFYQPIKDEVIEYFTLNKINWWGGKRPTGHALSSQIACINHLFAIRKDKQAVLSLLENISNDFIDVYEITTDKHKPAYIQFESISDKDHLREGQSSRGSNCTSIDALIFAKHKNGSKWLILIEWKYTEHYQNQNKAIEGEKKDPINYKGKKRKDRYTDIINSSNQLQAENHYCYYFEPFYQLMRQTLWVEQMIKHKSVETIRADEFLHLHIIPKENKDLLHKTYKCSGSDMESTWRKHLKDNTKYKIITPEDLIQNIDKEKYNDLIDYLTTRYWEK